MLPPCSCTSLIKLLGSFSGVSPQFLLGELKNPNTSNILSRCTSLKAPLHVHQLGSSTNLSVREFFTTLSLHPILSRRPVAEAESAHCLKHRLAFLVISPILGLSRGPSPGHFIGKNSCRTDRVHMSNKATPITQEIPRF